MADDEVQWAWPPLHPVTLCSLATATLSVLVTLVSYVVHDRLHSEKRRVVFPGHLTAFIWHICMVAGRIMALSLFATAFGPYVSIVIGIHWISSIVWGIFEKTNICGDITTTPPKKRLYLELPFVLVVSFVFLFVFVNIRDGSTKVRIMIYHVLTGMETLVLASLFYATRPKFPYSLWLLAGTVCLYVMGVAFMLLYYSACHPNRTGDCFCIGVPRSCDCCHVIYKLPLNDTYNVDQPLDGEEDDREGAGGITLINYNPLTNLSVLAERQSSFTIGKVSRSATTTPTGTPQHRVGGVSVQSRRNSISTTPQHTRSSNSRVGMRPGMGMEYLSSTPNIANNTRSPSVNLGMRPVSPGTRSRSYSEDVGMRPEFKTSSGIGQLSAIRRPTSESVDSPIFKQLTATRRPSWHQKRSLRNSQFSQQSSSHGGHYYDPDRPSMLLNITQATPTPATGSQTTPLPRHVQDASVVFNPSLTPTHKKSRPNNGRYSFQNYSGVVVLPSPIGEEPMSAKRGVMPSPVVVQVNGISPDSTVIQNGRSTAEPIYSLLYPNRNHSNRWSDVNYTDFTPSRRSRSIPTDTPNHITRRRSLSPVQTTGKHSGRTSPNYRSTNCTPRASPFPGKRHRNPSNPLHSHDPMKEFTKLYSSRHNGSDTRERKISNPATGETRVLSTSSSYIVSSDNHSDTDIEEPTMKSMSKTTPILQNHSNSITLQPPVAMTMSAKQRSNVTAHRQNSDEFLIANLHNVSGTLV